MSPPTSTGGAFPSKSVWSVIGRFLVDAGIYLVISTSH
jgi:hypothetical protein